MLSSSLGMPLEDRLEVWLIQPKVVWTLGPTWVFINGASTFWRWRQAVKGAGWFPLSSWFLLLLPNKAHLLTICTSDESEQFPFNLEFWIDYNEASCGSLLYVAPLSYISVSNWADSHKGKNQVILQFSGCMFCCLGNLE